MVSSLYNIMQNGPRAGVFITDWTDDYQVPSRSDWYRDQKQRIFGISHKLITIPLDVTINRI